jgi:ketosteroid isomerase-like protein
VTTSGKPYNNTYCIVLRLADGKIVQVDEYCDTELVTEAFGR